MGIYFFLFSLSEADSPPPPTPFPHYPVSVGFSLMFWTNWNEQKPSIMRSTLAGKNMRIIVGTDILTPNGLTVDHKAEKLYFSDGSLGKIERCDYDGSGRHVSRETTTCSAAVVFSIFFF